MDGAERRGGAAHIRGIGIKNCQAHGDRNQAGHAEPQGGSDGSIFSG